MLKNYFNLLMHCCYLTCDNMTETVAPLFFFKSPKQSYQCSSLDNIAKKMF